MSQEGLEIALLQTRTLLTHAARLVEVMQSAQSLSIPQLRAKRPQARDEAPEAHFLESRATKPCGHLTHIHGNRSVLIVVERMVASTVNQTWNVGTRCSIEGHLLGARNRAREVHGHHTADGARKLILRAARLAEVLALDVHARESQLNSIKLGVGCEQTLQANPHEHLESRRRRHAKADGNIGARYHVETRSRSTSTHKGRRHAARHRHRARALQLNGIHPSSIGQVDLGCAEALHHQANDLQAVRSRQSPCPALNGSRDNTTALMIGMVSRKLKPTGSAREHYGAMPRLPERRGELPLELLENLTLSLLHGQHLRYSPASLFTRLSNVSKPLISSSTSDTCVYTKPARPRPSRASTALKLSRTPLRHASKSSKFS